MVSRYHPESSTLVHILFSSFVVCLLLLRPPCCRRNDHTGSLSGYLPILRRERREQSPTASATSGNSEEDSTGALAPGSEHEHDLLTSLPTAISVLLTGGVAGATGGAETTGTEEGADAEATGAEEAAGGAEEEADARGCEDAEEAGRSTGLGVGRINLVGGISASAGGATRSRASRTRRIARAYAMRCVSAAQDATRSAPHSRAASVQRRRRRSNRPSISGSNEAAPDPELGAVLQLQPLVSLDTASPLFVPCPPWLEVEDPP